MDVISLTRKLLSFKTMDPPGRELEIAQFTGDLLSSHGFIVRYPLFRRNRLNLIAEKGLSGDKPPLVFSGHFDTVQANIKKWSVDPFEGLVSNDRIWGLGSSDMKSGLAAIIIASIEATSTRSPKGGIRIIFSAAEEPGCLGISKLVKEDNNLGTASAIIVGEPTGNVPCTGHKGGIYLKAVASGKTAHSSMPELGENAIYKAVRSISKIACIDFGTNKDPLLGFPTINVGKIQGGENINSVPERAEFTIDIRTTTIPDHEMILQKLVKDIGNDVTFKKLVDLKPVFTSDKDPFVEIAYEACGVKRHMTGYPKALPYLTDGAVLQHFYKGAPTLIIGPGQPEVAHKTDEYCKLEELERSVSIYRNIILRWGNQ